MSMSIFPHFNTLSRDEEYQLALQAKQGDKKAHNTLILSNIPFAIKYSLSFLGYKIDPEDLSQIGLIGLIEAVNKFDAGKGFRVITYVKWWIRKEIEEAAGKTRKESSTIPFSRLVKNEPDFDEEAFISSLGDNSKNPVEEECIENEKHYRVRKALERLSGRDSDIINRHYGLDGREEESFNDIAESYGLSKARIHQLEQATFNSLRSELGDLYDMCA
ncbi:MAG: sigma-70 family RNA polymerase sigma factor [Treponema sp.]|nr:sigma-70 family RNA polymerase sigma factor [Treponema sp.]